jgi:hypothetical protein
MSSVSGQEIPLLAEKVGDKKNIYIYTKTCKKHCPFIHIEFSFPHFLISGFDKFVKSTIVCVEILQSF